MSPDESCPHWTLHDGVCRDCGKRPKIERKPMTPKTDSVAVLRELRIGVELDAHLDPLGPAKIAALDAAIAALSAPGGVGDAVTEDDISRIEFAVENMRLADPSEEQIEARWNLAYRLGEIAKKLRAALAARTGKGEA